MRILPSLKFVVFLLDSICLARPSVEVHDIAAGSRTPYFVLAGDSTTAKQQQGKDGKPPGGGGWGDGFINALVSRPGGINEGHNGATTVSYKEVHPGWKEVMADVNKNVGKFDVYVTIQFGHNDQKPPAGIDDKAFKKNMIGLAEEVTKAKATPIFVTPLSRRQFSNGQVQPSLAKMRTNTIEAAGDKIRWIDLNKESTAYYQKLGEKAAKTFALSDADATHLNPCGSLVFGRMVADLVLDLKIPGMEDHIKGRDAVSQAIQSGKVPVGVGACK